jgi:hypothetical protein
MSKTRTDTERLDWLEQNRRAVDWWEDTTGEIVWEVEGNITGGGFVDLRDAIDDVIDAEAAQEKASDAEQSRP